MPMPRTAIRRAPWSNGRLRPQAARRPNGIASTYTITSAARPSFSVWIPASLIRSVILAPFTSELPGSPVTTFFMKMKYWAGSGSFNPSRSLTSFTSTSVPVMLTIDPVTSPGATRSP